MNEINLAQFILDIVRKKKEQVTELVMAGGVKDMEHYGRLMGNIDGLEYVEQELKSLLEKQELIDD
tara:strand:+ start:175 stop:372 length:198 start_codon:yes stop_codon:yes gene_type:complete